MYLGVFMTVCSIESWAVQNIFCIHDTDIMPWNLSFRHILFLEIKKKTPNDIVTPQCQSQSTPKMKANAVLHMLSSLVWIDHYNECNGMTSFMEFVQCTNSGIWLGEGRGGQRALGTPPLWKNNVIDIYVYIYKVKFKKIEKWQIRYPNAVKFLRN